MSRCKVCPDPSLSQVAALLQSIADSDEITATLDKPGTPYPDCPDWPDSRTAISAAVEYLDELQALRRLFGEVQATASHLAPFAQWWANQYDATYTPDDIAEAKAELAASGQLALATSVEDCPRRIATFLGLVSVADTFEA